MMYSLVKVSLVAFNFEVLICIELKKSKNKKNIVEQFVGKFNSIQTNATGGFPNLTSSKFSQNISIEREVRFPTIIIKFYL